VFKISASLLALMGLVVDELRNPLCDFIRVFELGLPQTGQRAILEDDLNLTFCLEDDTYKPEGKL
ncbi:3888_t:CDS:2, partial [Funneliformis mosseae]